MTTIYFIRHAETDYNIRDDRLRSLTPKGQKDCALVTEFLRDKKIDVVLSSPYKRAVDTVSGFAASAGLQLDLVEDFRERRVDSTWIEDFMGFAKKQWEDFSYKLSDGECLAEVQSRNIAALETVLTNYKGKNIVIGTHGAALSTIINYYDKTYCFENYAAMVGIMPWVVKMVFDGNICFDMVKIDLFNPDLKPDYTKIEVRTFNLGELNAYRYTVIFSRYKNKWLYCRAKDRDCYETAGGHIEPGETPLEAAKRELFEETGAVVFYITPAFDYVVNTSAGFANGQVFYAEIHEIGDMPSYEMAEIRPFDDVPDKMRFPMILPRLYKRLQSWLSIRTSKDEIWDIYDSNRNLTGRTHRRIDPLPDGDYHLVAVVCIQNSKGEFLLTKRAPNKGYPYKWEFQGGAAVAGDDSITTAIKEAREEAGLILNPENGELVLTRKSHDTFFDVWLFRQNCNIEDVVLQEGETIDAKYATADEIRNMIQNQAFTPCDFFEEVLAKA